MQADPCDGGLPFRITGHTGKGERRGLDRRRAAAVRGYLTRHGLRVLIGPVGGVGSSRPRIARPAGLEESQNRRVEIEAVIG